MGWGWMVYVIYICVYRNRDNNVGTVDGLSFRFGVEKFSKST